MGNKAYDFIIADETIISKENYEDYSEKIIFMPNSFFPNSLQNLDLDNSLTRTEFSLPNDKFVFCCLII